MARPSSRQSTSKQVGFLDAKVRKATPTVPKSTYNHAIRPVSDAPFLALFERQFLRGRSPTELARPEPVESKWPPRPASVRQQRSEAFAAPPGGEISACSRS